MTQQPHRLCKLLRELRETAGLSLMRVEERHGISVGTLGSYERGNRLPPLPVLEALLGFYGYRLEAVPANSTAVRRPVDVAAELRRLADQVEATSRGTVRAEAAGIQVAGAA